MKTIAWCLGSWSSGKYSQGTSDIAWSLWAGTWYRKYSKVYNQLHNMDNQCCTHTSRHDRGNGYLTVGLCTARRQYANRCPHYNHITDQEGYKRGKVLLLTWPPALYMNKACFKAHVQCFPLVPKHSCLNGAGFYYSSEIKLRGALSLKLTTLRLRVDLCFT